MLLKFNLYPVNRSVPLQIEKSPKVIVKDSQKRFLFFLRCDYFVLSSWELDSPPLFTADPYGGEICLVLWLQTNRTQLTVLWTDPSVLVDIHGQTECLEPAALMRRALARPSVGPSSLRRACRERRPTSPSLSSTPL